jgi:ACR3 family arsenite transporter
VKKGGFSIDVVSIAIPLSVYFLSMWFATFFIAYRIRANYAQTATLSFPAASNDFELAIFGIHSNQAFATVVGQFLQVPVFICLVNVSMWLRRRYFPHAVQTEDGICYLSCR